MKLRLTFTLAALGLTAAPLGASAAPDTSPVVARSTLSVPAMLCASKLVARLTTSRKIDGASKATVDIEAPFLLGSTISVDDGPVIVVTTPSPDHKYGPLESPIYGGSRIRCDRAGAVLKEESWR